MSTERNTMLMRLSEWDKMLAVTKDPLELKKGSEAIEAVRSMARLAHLGVEIVNMAFAERVKWDRKRGQWIEENIPKHNEKNDSWSTSRLKDIDTSWDESVYCQKLIGIPDEKVLHYINLCLSRDPPVEAGKVGLLRNATNESDNHEEPELPPGTFEVIYADPGWKYENFNMKNAAQVLYTTWPVDPLGELFGSALEKVTSKATVLFLWAVNPMLPEALHVMTEWGFKYKSNLVWVKPTPLGKAWWTRSQHELLLIGTRSKSRTPDWVPPSAFFCERGKHSEKPEEFRTVIERMFPGGSWLELFARSEADGWIVYGDEL